jgi:hypothetical protein
LWHALLALSKQNNILVAAGASKFHFNALFVAVRSRSVKQ